MLFLSFAAQADAQKLFFQPPSYVGTGPAVTADFNGDGKADIVSADGTVALGNGDGTFRYPIPLGGVTGLGPIATADFNGDGKPDLLLGSNVYLGNGDGTFNPPVMVGPGVNASAVAVADVNGDGKADVLVLIAGGGVLVFLGRGDGTFSTTSILYGGTFGTLLAVGDFNGDGKADIVLADDSGSGGAVQPVQVLLGNGDGTFRAATSSTGIARPQAMIVKDLNGDGKLDLAITTLDQTVALLGNGDGTFQAPGAPLLASGLLAVADVNGDGKPDIIVSQTFTQVFLGNGDGTFTSEGSVFGTAPASGISSTSMVVADFNGDGKPDVAVANALLLGNGDGTFQGSPAISLNEDPGALRVGSAAGDFNGDGSLDFAVPGRNGLYILLNKGNGSFTVAHTYPLGVVGTIATADLNKDGKLDLLLAVGDTSNPGVWNLLVMLGNGDGTFAASTQVLQGIPNIDLSGIADFNGDHVPDLAFATAQGVEIFFGKGDGTFALPVVYFIPGAAAGPLFTADFNNDGIVDIGTGVSNFTVLLGKGDGTFQPPIISSSIGGVQAVADLNGDGKIDLVGAVNPGFGWNLAVFLGNGDGTFRALPPVPGFPRLVSFPFVADVNGDGKPDLVEGQGLQILLGNGDGTFGSPITVIAGCPVCGGPYPVAIADVNGDHHPDAIIAVNQPPEVGLITLLNVAGPTSPDFAISTSALSPQTVAAGSTATTPVTLAPANGFSGTVALSCIGLPAGGSCSFAPASVPGGLGTSTLTITAGAATPANTYFVSVIGTASSLTHETLITFNVTATPDFSVISSTATSTVTAGQTATYMLSLAASGGFSGNVTLSCSGAPALASCSVSPTMVSVSGTTAATATVTVTTTAPSQMLVPDGTDTIRRINNPPTLPFAFLAFILTLASFSRLRRDQRFRWAQAVTAALLVCAGLTLTSCGGGSSGSGGTRTQAGTYTITVSASATAGSTTLTHTTNLTLVVR